MVALSRKTITSVDTPASRATLVRENQKTKLILLVSSLVFVRGLVLSLLSIFYILFSSSSTCSPTIRRLTVESQIAFTAMNFVVLYFYNQKFERAFLRPKLFCSNHERRCSNERWHAESISQNIVYPQLLSVSSHHSAFFNREKKVQKQEYFLLLFIQNKNFQNINDIYS